MAATDRTTTVEQPGIISAADLLREVQRTVGDRELPKNRVNRAPRCRAEVEIEEGQAFLSVKDVHASFTLRGSPEDLAALGSMLVQMGNMSEGRAGCWLAGGLEVAHGNS